MVINGNIFNYIFPKVIHIKGLRDTNAVMTMKKQKMKKRKMKSLTLQERILLCEIDDIDWNYSVKATKTNDIRTTIQGE